MTFRMRTTHLPSARLLGVPPWLRRLLPHGIYRVGLGHKVPSFGRGRGKVRVVVSAFAIVFTRERGRGSAERKPTAMNDWHHGCLFSIRAIFFLPFFSSIYFFSTSFVFYHFISVPHLRLTCFFHSLFYFERSYLARIVESHILRVLFSLLPLSFGKLVLCYTLLDYFPASSFDLSAI